MWKDGSERIVYTKDIEEENENNIKKKKQSKKKKMYKIYINAK